MLKHTRLRNQSIATSFGRLEFDENGENRQLNEEQEKRLGQIDEYEYVDETPKDEQEEDQEEQEEPEDKDNLKTMYEGMLEGNVGTVKERTKDATPEMITELLHLEREGKNRKSVIEHLEDLYLENGEY
jgi:hypothetical protein